MRSEKRTGRVVAVCMSPHHGFPTTPQENIYIGALGIPGDAHSGPTRDSFTNPGTQKPNDRPISIVADEVRQEMNQQFGLTMQPGDFNEQILIGGLGDLSDVIKGSRIIFSTGVVLEVVDRAYPCTRLERHNMAPNGSLINALTQKTDTEVLSRRGVLTRVLRPGNLHPDASIRIRTPRTP